MTEFKSRRELREAERQGLVPKPEVVFDLPTGQINLPNQDVATELPQDLPSASEMLTRKRIREMERLGLLDPLTGALAVNAEASTTENIVDSPAPTRAYDEVLAETEEPITASINAIAAPEVAEPSPVATTVSAAPPVSPSLAATPVAPTDIFHSMAVDLNARKPRVGLILGIILGVLAAAAAAAYMLGIFK
jgi:hypothetical protein